MIVQTNAAVYTWTEDGFVIRSAHQGGSMAITSDATQDMTGAAATIDRWIELQEETKQAYCGVA